MNVQNNEAMLAVTTEAMMADLRFQRLVRARSTLGWSLAAIMLVVYFGLIALVAFDKPLVAQQVGNGPTTIGIVLGIGVIITAVVLVGIYVAIANSRFDAMSRELNARIR